MHCKISFQTCRGIYYICLNGNVTIIVVELCEDILTVSFLNLNYTFIGTVFRG